MKESNTKHRAIAIQQIQKEIYSFLTTKSKSFITFPFILKSQSPLKAIVSIRYIFSMIPQVQIETKPKELIIILFKDLLTNAQQTIKQIKQFFGNNANYPQQIQQFATQMRSQATMVNIFSKLISLPTILSNLINDPKVNSPNFTSKEIQTHTKRLYANILQAINELSIEEQLIIINKLLVLKEERVIAQYFLKNNSSFLISNFDHFSKQSNLIKCIYNRFLNQVEGQYKNKIRRILVQLANNSSSITTCIMSLLNMNEIDYYSGEKYKQFYYLFYETNLKTHITKELLLWWAVSKNFIITKIHSKIRCNILAMVIENMQKQQLYSNDYLVSITQGIKKRLTDGQSREFAMLIWKIMGKKMELKLTDDIEKANYFQIICQKIEAPIHNDQTKRNDKQKRNKNINSTLLSDQSVQQPSLVQQTKQQSQDNVSQSTHVDQSSDIIKIQPKNIYDCILGLRNQHRKQIALKKLSSIIKRYKDDLILMWNSLLRELLSPIKEQYIPLLAELFTMRPEQFIDSVVMFFMNRQNNIGQKTHLMEIIKIGIEQLSSIHDDKEEQQDQGFYFKKMKSRYFKEAQQSKTNERQEENKLERTRRWGHTKIAHQNASKGITLNIVKKQKQINKFYPIANPLYYKIIDIFALNIINNLRSHQVYVHSLLKLLAVFVSNIKNHFDKYIVVSDVSSQCVKIIQQLLQNSKKKNDRYEETGGLTLMLALQVLNKVSLIIDQNITDNIMNNLKQAIQGGRKLPNYGMSSVLDMIESNIYQRVYVQKESIDVY